MEEDIIHTYPYPVFYRFFALFICLASIGGYFTIHIIFDPLFFDAPIPLGVFIIFSTAITWIIIYIFEPFIYKNRIIYTSSYDIESDILSIRKTIHSQRKSYIFHTERIKNVSTIVCYIFPYLLCNANNERVHVFCKYDHRMIRYLEDYLGKELHRDT